MLYDNWKPDEKKLIYLDLFGLLALLNTITSRIEPCYKYFKNGKFAKLQENNCIFSMLSSTAFLAFPVNNHLYLVVIILAKD